MTLSWSTRNHGNFKGKFRGSSFRGWRWRESKQPKDIDGCSPNCPSWNLHTPLKFNSSPLKRDHPRRKVPFQPSFFQGRTVHFQAVAPRKNRQLGWERIPFLLGARPILRVELLGFRISMWSHALDPGDSRVTHICVDGKGVKSHKFIANGCFGKYGYPQIIHVNRDFHNKPSILGYPYFFWKHPNIRISQKIGPTIPPKNKHPVPPWNLTVKPLPFFLKKYINLEVDCRFRPPELAPRHKILNRWWGWWSCAACCHSLNGRQSASPTKNYVLPWCTFSRNLILVAPWEKNSLPSSYC